MSPPATTGPGVRVLRASRRRYRRWLRGSVAAGGALVVVLVAAQARRVDSVADAIVLGVVLLGVPAIALAAVSVHVATSRVTIAGGRVEHRRWWRRTVLQAGGDLVGLLAVYRPRFANGPATPVLVARSASGGPRIHLSGAYWEQSDLDEVARALGVPVRDRVLDAKGYERRAPGALPWRERHWVLFGTGAALVVVGLVVAGVLLFFTTRGLPPFDEQPPRAVSPATVARQDAAARDVAAAVGGRWDAPAVRLSTCHDDDDYKGWTRSVELAPIEVPARMTDGSLAAVLEAAGRHGYRDVTGSKVDDVAVGLPGAAFGEDRVSVDLEAGSAGISVVGHCEVPGR